MRETSSSFRRRFEGTAHPISLSEIISALSFALDLTEGAIHGHALRSCLFGMRIAAELGLSEEERGSLYYALLLKDVGCSSNAARMYQIIGGDDRTMKTGARLEDWTRPLHPSRSALRLLWSNVLPGASAVQKIARIGRVAITQHVNNREMITLRCDRGSEILRKLGMGERSAEAIHFLDEHWDGSGYPERRRRQRIPVLSRICSIAQNIDVFATERSPHVAMQVLKERRGRWFDPEMVDLVLTLHTNGSLWEQCLQSNDVEETRAAVLDLAPSGHEKLRPNQIDHICEAFADVVDAKSPFTYRHSITVTDVAIRSAYKMGLPAERIQMIRRASLLHDIGKLRVPNSILDKHGSLTPDEWGIVREHPGLSRSILERVGAFEEVALLAGEHHERLDGSGYPDGFRAQDLSLESRLIAVADVFGALSEDRPYHAGMSLDEIVELLRPDLGTRLDADCFDAIIHSRDERIRRIEAPVELPLTVHP